MARTLAHSANQSRCPTSRPRTAPMRRPRSMRFMLVVVLGACLIAATALGGALGAEPASLSNPDKEDPAVRSLLNTALAAADPAALAAAAAKGEASDPSWSAQADAVLAAVRSSGQGQQHHTVGEDVRAALAVAARDPAALAAAVAVLKESGASSPPPCEDGAIAAALGALTELLEVDLDAAGAVERAPGDPWGSLTAVITRGTATLLQGEGAGDSNPPIAAAAAAAGVVAAVTRNDAAAAGGALAGAPRLAAVLVAAVRAGAGLPPAKREAMLPAWQSLLGAMRRLVGGARAAGCLHSCGLPAAAERQRRRWQKRRRGLGAGSARTG